MSLQVGTWQYLQHLRFLVLDITVTIGYVVYF